MKKGDYWGRTRLAHIAMRAGNLDEVRQILIEVTNLFVASSSNQSIVDVPERRVT